MISRRNFVTTILGATGLAACVPSLDNFLHAQANDTPRAKHYRRDGAAIVIEGQTLLAAFTFAEPLRTLDGSLPVLIEPASIGGDAITEPQPLYFYRAGDDGRIWLTFLTAPLDVVPGRYVLELNAISGRNIARQWQLPYVFQQGVYRNSFLTLSKEFSAPPPDIVARQQADFQATVAALTQPKIERQWNTPFILPTKGGYRSNYGDRRTVNRVKHYRHAGIDMTAGIGTPIRAMNDGVIALSADHWAPGQNIILNHGGGVFTKYIHLSRRDAQVGDAVKRGDVLALSGNTGGQKPGPHLHMDVFANGAAVNPLQFMQVAEQFLKVA